MKFNPPLTFFFGVVNYFAQTTFDGSNWARRAGAKSSMVLADTLKGRVRGIQEYSRGNHLFRFFRGIPYAQPPVGKLRYKPPKPHPGWKKTLDATWYKGECWQFTFGAPEEVPYGDEDCLYLNVATRKSHLKGHVPKDGLRPVIVWIHGGMFMVGSANAYEPKYFMEHDIVFVSLNYRLNSFGFLNTGDGVVSGNMGLRDQNLALKWIQENIEFFNGDPRRVIIIGQSAGGASVHLHTLSPMSRGLFSGAVSLSGNALNPWVLSPAPGEQARELAEAFRCNKTKHRTTKKMVKCLRKVPAEALARYHCGFFRDELNGLRGFWGPSVDSVKVMAKHKKHKPKPVFLPAHPHDLLLQGQVSDTPWIYGVNSGEGLVALIPTLRNENFRNKLNAHWEEIAPVLMVYQHYPNKDQISAALKTYYLNDQPVAKNNFGDLVNMSSDRAFYWHSHQVALLQARVAPVYAYYYEYEGLVSSFALLLDNGNASNEVPLSVGSLQGAAKSYVGGNVFMKKPTFEYGVSHGDELPILFNMPLVRKDINDAEDEDYYFSKKFVEVWVSFAERGTPDVYRVGENLDWAVLQRWNLDLVEQPIKMLAFRNTAWQLIDEPFYKRMQFWRQYDYNKEVRDMFEY